MLYGNNPFSDKLPQQGYAGNGIGTPPKATPVAQVQLDVLDKTMSDLSDAISMLDARLAIVLPPQPTQEGKTDGAACSPVGGGSQLFCRLLTLTDQAQGLASRVRFIADRLEV